MERVHVRSAPCEWAGNVTFTGEFSTRQSICWGTKQTALERPIGSGNSRVQMHWIYRIASGRGVTSPSIQLPLETRANRPFKVQPRPIMELASQKRGSSGACPTVEFASTMVTDGSVCFGFGRWLGKFQYLWQWRTAACLTVVTVWFQVHTYIQEYLYTSGPEAC